jgi:hypothetical protein
VLDDITAETVESGSKRKRAGHKSKAKKWIKRYAILVMLDPQQLIYFSSEKPSQLDVSSPPAILTLEQKLLKKKGHNLQCTKAVCTILFSSLNRSDIFCAG